jgi:maleylacetate reductase
MPATASSPGAGGLARGFVHDWPHSRVRFGLGQSTHVRDEIDLLTLTRVLLVTDPATSAAADQIAAACGHRIVGRIDEVIMHVPADLAAHGAGHARALNADGLLSIGGGSATGLAKGIARLTGLPAIAVPTTYAGSEMTAIWGLTEDGRKITGRDERVRPRTVIYDPALTTSLPAEVTVTSAINAVAHCAEALYSDHVSPVTVLCASDAVTALLLALPAIATDPADPAARSQALYGAWLAGWALNVAAMGLHHKLCHILGGTFDLPHAALHTVILPHVLAYNTAAAPAALAAFAGALSRAGHPAAPEQAAATLREVIASLNGPTSLQSIGLDSTDLHTAVTTVTEQLASARPVTPRDPSPVDLAALLTRAQRGETPAAGGPAT